MKSRDKIKQNDAIPDEAFEREVFRALVECGEVVPETEAEVEAAEKRINEQSEAVPKKLRNADAILERMKTFRDTPSRKVIPLPESVYAETGRELARAARKGSEIPSAIEEKMRKNREKADAEDSDESEPK